MAKLGRCLSRLAMGVPTSPQTPCPTPSLVRPAPPQCTRPLSRRFAVGGLLFPRLGPDPAPASLRCAALGGYQPHKVHPVGHSLVQAETSSQPPAPDPALAALFDR